MVRVAVPLASGADPMFCLPSENTIWPVGDEVPLAAVTVAVRSIEEPWSACEADEATAVDVLTRETTGFETTEMLTGFDVDFRKAELPP